jgi:hypothetical protein
MPKNSSNVRRASAKRPGVTGLVIHTHSRRITTGMVSAPRIGSSQHHLQMARAVVGLEMGEEVCAVVMPQGRASSSKTAGAGALRTRASVCDG